MHGSRSETLGWITAITGGLGLGLLLGSGYPSTATTIIGTVILVAAIIGIVLLTLKKKGKF